MTGYKFDAEEFCALFDAALAEADKAAREAHLRKPGSGAVRDQKPLVAVDRYVDRMIEEIAELRAYQDKVIEWWGAMPMTHAEFRTATIGGMIEIPPAPDALPIKARVVSPDDDEPMNPI